MRHIIDLQRYAHEKEMRAFCENKGLSIVFEDEHRPRTDGRSVYVGKPNPAWNEEELVKWKWSIYHEMGHNVPEMRDCFDIPKKYKIDMKSFIGTALNLVDDYRQEHFKYDEYYGKYQVMSKACALQYKDIIAGGKLGDYGQDIRWGALCTMLAWDTGMRESWLPHMSGMQDQMKAQFTQQQLEWLEKLEAGDYANVINSCPTAEEEYTLVKRILDEVFNLDSEAEEQAAQQSAAGSEGEEAGDGEGTASKASGRDDGDGGEKGKRKVDGSANYQDILLHKHDEDDVETSYSALHIDYSTFTPSGYNARTLDEIRVKDYSESGARNRDTYYSEHIQEVSASSGLAKKVRKLLQVYSQSMRIHGQKAGKISGRSAYRATIKGADNYSQRVFKKKIESNVLDSSVLILCDASASMGGDKYTYAARSAILLNDAVAKLGVPVEVVTFNERGRNNSHGIIKKFKENVTAAEIADRFSDFASGGMGCNADGESILWAAERLAKQQTKKKIMIVLSDGSPASTRGDCFTFTKEVVDEIEKSKQMEIYGIGIMDDNVKLIYSNAQVINRPEEIETAIFNLIRNRIIKH